jgi:uncharacterized protein YndB with AHSA1/START domain
MTIDLDATPEDVWRALTVADELVRWFAVQAHVTPGPGGTMHWRWDDQYSWDSNIAVWEPPTRLVLTEERPATDITGAPIDGPAHKVAMEFTLETHAGRTRLRLVHSGFGHGADWDDELDAISGGWQFELRGLRFYLERHRGRDRVHAAVMRTTTIARDVLWHRLLGPSGFIVTGQLAEGEQCTVTLPNSSIRLEGRVVWYNPGRDLAVIVSNLDDGVFRLSVWNAGDQTGVQIWLVSYTPRHAAVVREFGRAAEPVVDRLVTASASAAGA